MTETRAQRPGAAAWVPADGDIAALARAAHECRGCELWEPASQVVFSAGTPQGPVALVGEQPGDVEDQRGLPFVGPAGRLLQRAVEQSGVGQRGVYVTNAVKHFRFRPDSRSGRRLHVTPDLEHIAACRPWLTAELRLVAPSVVVLLGATAAKSLLGSDFRISRHRGEVIRRRTSIGERPFVPTYHPSAVLRMQGPQQEEGFRELVDHLGLAAKLLGEAPA